MWQEVEKNSFQNARQKSLRLFEITLFRFINARRELIKLWIEIRFGDLIDTLHSLMIFNVVESHLNSHYREAFSSL